MCFASPHRSSARCWILMLLLLIALPGMAADWPAFRRDAQRSAVTEEKPAFPLSLAWQYTCAQPPAPAWPPTTKLFNRLEFDYAPQPVVAGGIVCFGSSADDTIRALDATTGEVKWTYPTGGPVRFAPHIAAGKVYAVSDDGYVYCLDAATGKEVWTFRAAPSDDRLLAHGRMISRWPLRCGVLVDGGVVYTVAGMWPSEGIFIYALNAATGKVIWCNDTAGALAPGDGLASGRETYFFGNLTGVAPQGMLLLAPNELVMPQGQGVSARIDRKTGKLLKFGSSRKHSYTTGPPFAMVGDTELVYSYFMNPKGLRDQGIRQTLARSGYTDLPQPSRGETGMANPEKGLDVTLLATKDRLYARQGYSIALVGETLLVGEDGAVAAYEAKLTTPPRKKNEPARYDAATQRELWRVPVNGQARGLAVANGRVYVTTDRGEIYCFAAGSGAPVHHQPAAAFRAPQAHPLAAATRDRLRAAGMDRGNALLLGDADGSLAVNLAARTALRIITVVPDEAAARALRARLLDTTALHGSRIQVFAAPKDGRLPFTQYFANAVIVAGDMGSVPAAELYRLLRPLGGVLLCPGLPAEQARAVAKASGAPAAEIREGALSVVRGPLPGALDWNSLYPSDRHLRAPLRPLWFGGPAAMECIERGTITDGPAPVAANGRLFYLLNGQIVAIDAYNGLEWWRRDIPRDIRPMMVDGEEYLVETPPFDRVSGSPYAIWRRAPMAIPHFAADADSVYLTLGKTCFRGKGEMCVKLNAATGEQEALYGSPAPSPRVSVTNPQTWSVKTGEAQGTLTLSADAAGVNITLATKGAGDFSEAWTLFFDFRPAAKRYGFYERGTFQVHILPAPDAGTPAGWEKGRGEAIPELIVAGTRTADGSATSVRLPWAELVALTGEKPRTFGFAASLRTGIGEQRQGKKLNKLTKSAAERYLFGDPLSEVLNNGWPTIILEEAPEDLAALEKPAIIAGPLEALPARLRVSTLGRFSHYKPDETATHTTRLHPFTGDPSPRTYRRGNGCGIIYSSAFMHYMRSGTLGYFDLLDDSGIRHFGGARMSCGMNMFAAFGVLFANEDGSDCGCQYSFQLPFALAPAEKRLHEDWAFFTDTPIDTQVRMAAVNFAAPGDRRDDDGTLWLNFPGYYAEFAAPLRVETAAGFGPYRVNADRVPIAKTDRPWIYASQYRGITKAVLQVDFRKPLTSTEAAQPPVLDGKLDEAAWGEKADFTLPNTKTDVFLRHDAAHLYVAARRPAAIGRDGKPTAWRNAITKHDGPVWNDDSLEIFLSDPLGSRVVHLGVSASGARYDAVAAGDAEREDAGWTGAWRSAVTADGAALIVEVAVPLATLAAAGLDPQALAVNLQMNQRVDSADGTLTRGEALYHLGGRGRSRCVNFTPLGLGATPTLAPRQFTVRLHFAELDDVKPGDRVFDVKLQGRPVLKDFDVAKEAGLRTALVKEFQHIPATQALTLEFVPTRAPLTAATAPILNAIEVYEEGFAAPARANRATR